MGFANRYNNQTRRQHRITRGSVTFTVVSRWRTSRATFIGWRTTVSCEGHDAKTYDAFIAPDRRDLAEQQSIDKYIDDLSLDLR